MTRMISSIISAFILSLVFTMISHTNEDNVLSYTFTSKFLTGFVILLAIYLFIAVPISIFIDLRIKKYGKFAHLLLYCLGGFIMGGLFLLINPTSNPMAGFRLTLLFALGGGVFSMVLNVLRLFVRR
ncbi:hypothetical protein [Paenibacillus fonticola]|uniref:hypothetical protein n=1 Tax=Paenibacillus fonticola TaxID=379896 RepID=UPI00036100EA|nr:hypothetical protein [Paenibacillus fonticola]